MKIDYDRLVIVASLHGEKFIGYVPPGMELSPQEYMRSAATANQPVTLHEVRTLLSQPQMRRLESGEEIIAGFVAVLPFEFMLGATEELWVRPSSWYFPADNEDSKKEIEALLTKAELSEKKLAAVRSAMEAGLSVPTGLIRR